MTTEDVLNEAEENLYTKAQVLELTQDGISDYARGVVFGRIEMLNLIKARLGAKDDEDDSELHS